jgi:capsular polysaccharide biosynthesis protein
MDLKDLRHLFESGRLIRNSAARTASYLPGSSIHFGPPRRKATTSSIHDALALVRQRLLPPRSSIRPVPEQTDPPLDEWMSKPRAAEIKEVFVTALPQGRYWGRYHGYVVDRNDTLLTDLSPTYTAPDKRHDGLDQVKLPPVQQLRGTVAVINTLYAFNFHHWLLDTLPRFEWIRRAGWHWSKIDHFIVPKRLMPYHLEIFELLGIDKSKLICTSPKVHIQADLLLVPGPSEPADMPLEYDYTPEGLRFVRQLLLEKNPSLQKEHPKRLLISRERARTRRLVQAERANQMLFDLGFEKVALEDYSLQEQAALFHQADCIVMPTGGNLANCVSCRPGTVVIEMFSKNYYPPFTYAMLGEIGLRYYGLVAEKVSRPFPEARFGNEDIDLDPDRLAETVRRALATLQPIPAGA